MNSASRSLSLWEQCTNCILVNWYTLNAHIFCFCWLDNVHISATLFTIAAILQTANPQRWDPTNMLILQYFLLVIFVSFIYFTGFTGKCCFFFLFCLGSSLALFNKCPLVRSYAVGFVSFILPNVFALLYENRYVSALVLNIIFFLFLFYFPSFDSSGWMLVSVHNNDHDNDVFFEA